MPKKSIKRPPKADQIYQMLCSCGCGQVYVVLVDRQGKDIACFSMDEDYWVPFAQDCVRISHGEEPLGPPNSRGRLN